MHETKPFVPLARPEPRPTEPSPNSAFCNADELIEQLTVHIEQLTAVNEQLRSELQAERQLLAVVANSTPLISYGKDTKRRIMAARSIKEISLAENGSKHPTTGLWEGDGSYAVAVDESQVTEFLTRDQALTELAKAEAEWGRALQPPNRS